MKTEHSTLISFLLYGILLSFSMPVHEYGEARSTSGSQNLAVLPNDTIIAFFSKLTKIKAMLKMLLIVNLRIRR